MLETISKERNLKQNKIEEMKSISSMEDAYTRLIEYSIDGYSSISKEDKSYFLKCFGIFDKGDNDFMLRVRIPAGRLRAKQAMVVGEVAREYGQDYIDLTTRMQLELRYLRIEDLPTVMMKLEDIGITTYQTGIDNFRGIVTDMLDGVAQDGEIECYPYVEAFQEVFLKKEEWIGKLPRKFNTAILGCRENRANIFGHDCAFVLAEKEGIKGFNVFLGGRVGVQAQPANIFVKDKAEAVLFFHSLIKVFKRYGFRDNRNKNRLHFFIEDVGMKTLIHAIESEANHVFSDAGKTLVAFENSLQDHRSVPLKDGTFTCKLQVLTGIFTGSAMIDAAKMAEIKGSGELRIGYDQNLYILGISKEERHNVLNSELFTKYGSDSIFHRGLIACAGTEQCSFGVIPNKPDALKMADELAHRFPGVKGRIRMYWSGCVKGCGLHGIGDIGFEGCKAKDQGQTVFGVHILIGGRMSSNQEGEILFKSIPLTKAYAYVEKVVLLYLRLRQGEESFEAFYTRFRQTYSLQCIQFFIFFNVFVSERWMHSYELSWPLMLEQENEVYGMIRHLKKELENSQNSSVKEFMSGVSSLGNDPTFEELTETLMFAS